MLIANFQVEVIFWPNWPYRNHIYKQNYIDFEFARIQDYRGRK